MAIRWQSGQLSVLLESLDHFFETNGEVKTVNSDRYLHLLRNTFIPALRRRVIHPADIYFQQDGATTHTSGQVLGWLQKTFGR